MWMEKNCPPNCSKFIGKLSNVWKETGLSSTLISMPSLMFVINTGSTAQLMKWISTTKADLKQNNEIYY